MSAREEEIIPKQNMYFPDENIFHFVSYFKNKVNKRYWEDEGEKKVSLQFWEYKLVWPLWKPV